MKIRFIAGPRTHVVFIYYIVDSFSRWDVDNDDTARNEFILLSTAAICEAISSYIRR